MILVGSQQLRPEDPVPKERELEGLHWGAGMGGEETDGIQLMNPLEATSRPSVCSVWVSRPRVGEEGPGTGRTGRWGEKECWFGEPSPYKSVRRSVGRESIEGLYSPYRVLSERG